MNGPQHYREAERLLDAAANMGVPREVETYRLRIAQVHATLALAAATYDSAQERNSDIGREWYEAIR